MAKGRITKRAIDSLRCDTGRDRLFLWDSSLAGFGVAVFPSGKKVYVAQYRKDGHSHRVAIGDHGRLSPTEARSEAKAILGAVEKGIDPIKLRRSARAARTFRQVADEFMVHHVAAKRKARTYGTYRDVLEKHIFPALKSCRIINLTRGDLVRLHPKMHATPSAANRALAVVSSIWNWAARREEV